MNEAELRGKWEQIKGAIKEKWGRLTDDDLAVIEGRQEQFIGKLQEVYAMSRQEAERQLRQFLTRPWKEREAAERTPQRRTKPSRRERRLPGASTGSV